MNLRPAVRLTVAFLAVAMLAVAVTAVLVPSSGAEVSRARAKSTTVGVKDDVFAPPRVTIKQNTKVKFKWDPTNMNSHNVILQQGPKGVKLGCPTKGKNAYSPLISKCNKSATGVSGIKFTKKFDKAGTYKFLCAIHPTTMNVTVKVNRSRKRN